MPQNAAPHPTKCDVINDMKLFPTVYRRIYCRKFLTLFNQKSRYKNKCIRIRLYWYPNLRYHYLSFSNPASHTDIQKRFQIKLNLYVHKVKSNIGIKHAVHYNRRYYLGIPSLLFSNIEGSFYF